MNSSALESTTASPRKKLPIGIQSLRELREEGHYYADKSGYAVDLAQSGKLKLEQIKLNHYADKYRARGEPIHLIGVAFGKDSRNIVGFEVEAG